MPKAVGPYTIAGTGPTGDAMTVTRDGASAAIKRAVELIGMGLKGVHIVDGDGHRYEPPQFDRLFTRARVQDAHRT
jgi:hypothetical protein